MEKTILITGASSGLGLAFLKHYASQPSITLIALDVNPIPSSAQSSNIKFHQCDITSEDSLSAIQAQYKGTPIHLMLHSAGIRGLVASTVKEKPGNVAAAETYEVMSHATMMKTLEINTWGTFNIIKTFLANLRFATSLTLSPSSSQEVFAKVVILSSRMGSITANTFAGGGYAYRASKAGLNAIVKSFSIDVPDVTYLLLHPGRVETGLVEWKEEGAISAEESLKTCLDVIERAGKQDSGSFVDRFGDRIEW
ncbi:NAD(P)-binding protein [Massarina eburnea CBS 473.64]|uniref:NAD(P)-binding protein n=1 Tax=Massarina eburnea CBS 473.64 TaxID=1395130 RepID=A0A6A6S6E2_9PLEO|nr:NAD(P)-binding protein [Massarina eburnea CBS 473.64]